MTITSNWLASKQPQLQVQWFEKIKNLACPDNEVKGYREAFIKNLTDNFDETVKFSEVLTFSNPKRGSLVKSTIIPKKLAMKLAKPGAKIAF